MEIPDYVRCGVCVHLIKQGRDKLVVEPDCLRSGGESKGELMCAFGMEGCVLRLQVREREREHLSARHVPRLSVPTTSQRLSDPRTTALTAPIFMTCKWIF